MQSAGGAACQAKRTGLSTGPGGIQHDHHRIKMKEMLRTLGSTRAPLILTVGGFIVLIISLLSPDRRGPSSLNLVYMDDNGESEGH
eukprot:5054-Eustigmatos_ZCMA.PRE.1